MLKWFLLFINFQIFWKKIFHKTATFFYFRWNNFHFLIFYLQVPTFSSQRVKDDSYTKFLIIFICFFRTVSEARSYDETTIQPPMRSLHNLFHLRTHTCDSKHSSSHKTNLDVSRKKEKNWFENLSRFVWFASLKCNPPPPSPTDCCP